MLFPVRKRRIEDELPAFHRIFFIAWARGVGSFKFALGTKWCTIGMHQSKMDLSRHSLS